MDYAMILTVLGALTMLTNLITEAIKPLTAEYIPTEVTATFVAEALTLGAYFGWTSWQGLTAMWYTVAAAVVAGMLVSYAAQFGFDKLKAAMDSVMKGSIK